MKTIIVATDFSPVSINAAKYAADMAIDINAEILLINVYNIPVAFTDAPLLLISVDELRKSSEELLENLKTELLNSSATLRIKLSAVMGDTIDELEKICADVKPFAIILGTKGVSNIEKVLFGSTTLTAIRHLTYPVISVPPEKSYGKGIKKIGFACDFKQVETTTPVQAIKQFVTSFGAVLHVLNVDYHEKNFRSDTPVQSFHLHNMLEDIHPQYHFIKNKEIDAGINEFAIANQLDMIIAIPKKHKILEGIFKTSNSKQIVLHSSIPVMCIHE